MTEKEIQLLGFEQQIEDEDGFYYYTHDITNGLSFISNSNDETIDGKWYIEVFNTEDAIRFFGFEEVQNLLNILEKHKIK